VSIRKSNTYLSEKKRCADSTKPKLKIHICNFFSVDRNKYQIHIPLPPKIDPTVTMMQVEEKPDVTYSDVGGCKEQIDKLREVCVHVNVTPEFLKLGYAHI